MPIIAEDLGVITADVHALRQSIGAPGMVVLQFAWGSGATNTHLPHNHYENSVCYPGDPPLPLPTPGPLCCCCATPIGPWTRNPALHNPSGSCRIDCTIRSSMT